MKLHVVITMALLPISVAHAQNAPLLLSTVPERPQSSSLGPQSPRALPSPGSLSLTPQLGSEINYGGLVSNEVTKSYSGSATFVINGSTVTINGVTVSSPKKRFEDVYEKPLIVGLGAAYGLSSDSEVFGGVRVVYARGKTSSGVTYSGTGTVNGTAASGGITSEIKPSDYKSFGVDAGYRRFFPQGGRITPYLGALVGVQTTDKTDIKETLLGASGKARVYDSSITPSVGLQVGITYGFENGGSIGVESGLRFDAKRKGYDKDIADDFSSINDTGGRLSIPVMFTGRIPLKPENLQK